jgi:membrane-associated phospholipid phosphatase
VRLDGPVLWWVAGHREAWLTGVVRVVTELGSGRVLVPLLLVVGVAVALRTRRWTVLGLLGVAELGAAGLYLAVKQLVARPRPPLALALVDTHSQLWFPSGHAAQAAACWGVLAWLVGGLPAWRRAWPMAVGAWTAALLVALAVAAPGSTWGCTGRPTCWAAGRLAGCGWRWCWWPGPPWRGPAHRPAPPPQP